MIVFRSVDNKEITTRFVKFSFPTNPFMSGFKSVLFGEPAQRLILNMEFPETIEEAFHIDSEALAQDSQRALLRWNSLQGSLFEQST